MSTKTFIQENLKSADLNAYTLKGDSYIASASVTAGQLLNCFNSTYTDYKIVVSNFVATADCYLWFQLGYLGGSFWSTASYYSGGSYQAYSTGTVTTWNNNATDPNWKICAGTTAATGFPNSAVVNISRPGLSNYTCYTAQSTLHLSGGIWAWSHMGQHAVTTAMDSFKWGTTAGAVSSGNITIYGVMQP